jgi:hypothetical protein
MHNRSQIKVEVAAAAAVAVAAASVVVVAAAGIVAVVVVVVVAVVVAAAAAIIFISHYSQSYNQVDLQWQNSVYKCVPECILYYGSTKR